MGIKAIAISMVIVMALVFILYRPVRNKEKIRTKLEVDYFEALKSKSENVKDVGILYYENLGLNRDSALVEIEKDLLA
ncbi:hypothetical protein [Halobacteriovorax sp. HLS]|uniref:hypothetical protein n=1 Tax=Halobacteriovorax sp. HLS TaxID=2234000 RepID=UPI000FD9B647|nr:hypothetical protein [Halobacteriovorax sp. HLS]